MSHRAVYAQL